jgi:hypothetical protein
MSAITSRGRRGSTVVPNWRWEDQSLDPFELRIAGWLASHTDSYREDHITRNVIAKATGVSAGKVTGAVARLVELGIVHLTEGVRGRWVVEFDFDAWEDRSPRDQSSGHDMTSDRSPRDQSLVTTRPVEPSTPISGEDQQETTGEKRAAVAALLTFDVFWDAYPRNGAGKGEARMLWGKLSKRDRADAMAGAIRHRDCIVAEPGRFVLPNGDVWLRHRRWEDPTPRTPPSVTALRPTSKMERVRQRLAAEDAQTAEGTQT